MKGKKIKYNKEDLELAIKQSNTYIDVFRYLKLCTSNYSFLKRKIKEYNIDISHFNQSNSKKGKVKRKLEELLVKDGPIIHNGNLKEKLYNSNLKKRECELCGQDENWNGKKISLILDHINGDCYDNRLENLRLVCPNCNATLDTHCGKNKKKKLKINNKEEKINLLKEKILNSDIDFTKKGWSVILGKKLGRSSMNALTLIKKYFPEIYIISFKHKY